MEAVAKVAATNLDMQIRNLQPDNPVQLAWVNTDRHSNMFANVIPTKEYKLTNESERRAPLFGMSVLGDPQPSLHPPPRNQTCAEGV